MGIRTSIVSPETYLSPVTEKKTQFTCLENDSFLNSSWQINFKISETFLENFDTPEISYAKQYDKR